MTITSADTTHETTWDASLEGKVDRALQDNHAIATRTDGNVNVARMNEDLIDVLNRLPGLAEQGRLANREELIFVGDDSGAVHLFSIASPDKNLPDVPRADPDVTLGEVYMSLGASEHDPTESTQVFEFDDMAGETLDYALTYEGALIPGP